MASLACHPPSDSRFPSPVATPAETTQDPFHSFTSGHLAADAGDFPAQYGESAQPHCYPLLQMGSRFEASPSTDYPMPCHDFNQGPATPNHMNNIGGACPSNPAASPQPVVQAQGEVSPQHNHFISKKRSSPLPTLYREQSFGGSSLNIVMEDPTTPNSYRERRVRTKTETDKQREDTQLLKEFGGACLWCYRMKKKCWPALPCPPCASTRRKCIREPSQLSLFSPQNGPCSSRILQTIKDSFLQQTCQTPDNTRVVVQIRQSPTALVDIWVTEMSQLRIASVPSEDTVQQFISKSLAYVYSSELHEIEARFGDNRLVQSVTAMAKLFIALQTLSKTQIYIRPADVGVGRMAMIYILSAYTQGLCEMSNGVSTELLDAMRRKDPLDKHVGMTDDLISTRGPSHIWIAAGLYYRVISGISSLKLAPTISRIFDANRLADVHAHVWSVVSNFPLHQGPNTKQIVRDALACYVPEFSGPKCFDIAFWLESGHLFPPPTALYRQTEPYSGSSYDMESFLNDDFPLPKIFPSFGSYSAESSRSPSQWSDPPHGGSTDTYTSSQSSSESPLAEHETFDDLLDPLGTVGWDSTTAIDSFYGDSALGLQQYEQNGSQVGNSNINQYLGVALQQST